MKAGFDRERFLSLFLVILFLLLWEWLSATGLISGFIFPKPSRILIYLFNALAKGELLENMLSTLSRLLAGFFAGGFPGLLVGLVMGWRPRVRAVFEPIISILHPIPKIALFPMLMIIFGIGETSKVVLIALAVFFPTLINAVEGVRQIPSVYLEVAQNMNASRWLIFKRIILPASLPFVLAGARIALNIGLIVTLSIELLNGTSGLGVMMWYGWQLMRLEQVYGVVFIIGIIGAILNVMFSFLRRWLVPWHQMLDESKIKH